MGGGGFHPPNNAPMQKKTKWDYNKMQMRQGANETKWKWDKMETGQHANEPANITKYV